MFKSFIYRTLILGLVFTAHIRTVIAQLIMLPILIVEKNWEAIEVDWEINNVYKRLAFGTSSCLNLIIFAFATKDFEFKSMRYFIMFNSAWDEAYLHYIEKISSINMSKLSFQEKGEIGSILEEELEKELNYIGFYDDED